LYTRKYPPDAYRNEVKAMVRLLQDRYGLRPRQSEERARPDAASEDAEDAADTETPGQTAFRWE
jgi:hypothetical protein